MRTADPIVIVGAARTPMGGFLGDLKDVTAPALGARAIAAAVERAGISGESVDEIFMGCVLPAGLGQAPARQAAHRRRPAAIAAGATTVNKMCGSGMQAAMLAHDALAAGSADVVVAGGMESMTQRALPAAKRRSGSRMGHDRVIDSHVPRRARGRLRQRAADGRLRRGLRRSLPVHPRRRRTLTRSSSLERAQARDQERRFRRRDRPRQREGAARRQTLVSTDEQPPQGAARTRSRR